jgi:uncharacterized repeat protein (TIGR03943 family)
MGHTHEHAPGSTYYLDQLCTIAACGGLGGVSIMMYFDGRLQYILTPFFFVPVLVGGIALAVMAIIRAITLWREAGALAINEHQHDHEHHHQDHDHGHEHHHDHEHSHDHTHEHHHHDHGHSHDHGHDHGWTPARYAVLMLPIVLFFLNLPNSTFSPEAYGRMMSTAETDAVTAPVAKKEGLVLGFKELTNAAHDQVTRKSLEGQTGRLTGMFQPSASDKQFTLFRVKMSCCAADAIPVGVLIVSEENVTRFQKGNWVEVEGKIEFHKLRGQEKWVPVLRLASADQVKETAAGSAYGLD